MKLGANTVLFGGYHLETAFKYLAMAGYDGVEIAALPGMAPHHLDPADWRQTATPQEAAERKQSPRAPTHTTKRQSEEGEGRNARQESPSVSSANGGATPSPHVATENGVAWNQFTKCSRVALQIRRIAPAILCGRCAVVGF